MPCYWRVENIDHLLISTRISQGKRKYLACNLKCAYSVFTFGVNIILRIYDNNNEVRAVSGDYKRLTNQIRFIQSKRLSRLNWNRLKRK